MTTKVIWISNQMTTKSLESQIRWQPNHLNLKSDDNQINWISNQMTTKSLESQIKWQPNHLNLKSDDNQINWISNQMTTKSLESQIRWQPNHLNLKSDDNQINWISNHLTLNSFGSDISWLSNHLNSTHPRPIGSLSLETSATALCVRYVIRRLVFKYLWVVCIRKNGTPQNVLKGVHRERLEHYESLKSFVLHCRPTFSSWLIFLLLIVACLLLGPPADMSLVEVSTRLWRTPHRDALSKAYARVTFKDARRVCTKQYVGYVGYTL